MSLTTGEVFDALHRYSAYLTVHLIIMASKQKKSGCGCIPFSFLLLFVGLGIWTAPRLTRINIETARSGDVVAMLKELTTDPQGRRVQIGEASSNTPIPQPTPANTSTSGAPLVATAPLQATPPLQSAPQVNNVTAPTASPVSIAATPDLAPTLPAAWQAKTFRGIYLSRYMATNRASEQMIRERVRYFKAQGINTIIHGVWGNGCTMYKSEVMKQTLGYSSCPNQFQDGWLDWLIDEAHQQGMEVHAYFEKGIKLDENSP
ncbi:MAG: family 10 glycosylhydrolase [Cyanobacteria bacterium J06598_3]